MFVIKYIPLKITLVQIDANIIVFFETVRIRRYLSIQSTEIIILGAERLIQIEPMAPPWVKFCINNVFSYFCPTDNTFIQ